MQERDRGYKEMTDVMDIIYILMSLALSIGVALCLIAKLLRSPTTSATATVLSTITCTR